MIIGYFFRKNIGWKRTMRGNECMALPTRKSLGEGKEMFRRTPGCLSLCPQHLTKFGI